MNPQVYAVDAFYDGHYVISPCSEDHMCSGIETKQQYGDSIPAQQRWYNQAFNMVQPWNTTADIPINGPFILELKEDQIQSESYGYYRAIDLTNGIEPDTINRPLEHRLHLYTLVNDYSQYLPLSTGRYPQASNELIVDRTTAQWLVELLGLSDIDQLMVQPLTVSITPTFNRYSKLDYCALNSPNASLCQDQQGNSLVQPMTTDIDYTVVGISDTDNQYIHIAYAGGSFTDSLLYTSFIRDVDALKFYYLDIMVDPLCDIPSMVKTMEQTFNPMMDTFQTSSSRYDFTNDDTSYLDPTIYQRLIILVVIIMMISILACYGFNHKQTQWIKTIYTRHHYPYRKLIILKNSMAALGIITMISIGLIILSLIQPLNHLGSMFLFLVISTIGIYCGRSFLE